MPVLAREGAFQEAAEASQAANTWACRAVEGAFQVGSSSSVLWRTSTGGWEKVRLPNERLRQLAIRGPGSVHLWKC